MRCKLLYQITFFIFLLLCRVGYANDNQHIKENIEKSQTLFELEKYLLSDDSNVRKLALKKWESFGLDFSSLNELYSRKRHPLERKLRKSKDPNIVAYTFFYYNKMSYFHRREEIQDLYLKISKITNCLELLPFLKEYPKKYAFQKALLQLRYIKKETITKNTQFKKELIKLYHYHLKNELKERRKYLDHNFIGSVAILTTLIRFYENDDDVYKLLLEQWNYFIKAGAKYDKDDKWRNIVYAHFDQLYFYTITSCIYYFVKYPHKETTSMLSKALNDLYTPGAIREHISLLFTLQAMKKYKTLEAKVDFLIDTLNAPSCFMSLKHNLSRIAATKSFGAYWILSYDKSLYEDSLRKLKFALNNRKDIQKVSEEEIKSIEKSRKYPNKKIRKYIALSNVYNDIKESVEFSKFLANEKKKEGFSKKRDNAIYELRYKYDLRPYEYRPFWSQELIKVFK